ncbi:MAG: radical SAM protein [Verrucomicrobia bacterium]|nr:radical SAM protein [Verrucomicrobiota bacterium]
MKKSALNRMVDIHFEIPTDWKNGVPFDQNPYPSVLVDITSRCNMRCKFCYYPEQDQADISLERFRHLCGALPFPVLMKLAGGEPTLHPQLPEIIQIAVEHKHRIYVCSNGMKYRDPDFMESLQPLKKLPAGFGLGLSMDGGTENAKAYELITGRDCLNDKLEAFQALAQNSHSKVSLTAIIVRGLNEDVIPQLVDLAKNNPDTVGYLHFRNAGKVGAFVDTEPYSLEEIKALTQPYFSEEEFAQACLGEVHCPPGNGRTCCYRFRPNRRLQISLIEFVSDRAANCPKRGRVVLGEDRIFPLFHSIRNEI